MATRKCSLCETRNVGTGPGHDADQARAMGYCNTCLTEADWENVHSDDAHQTGTVGDVDGCWICYAELNPNNKPIEAPKAGHTNTVAKSYTSHVGHHHPRTPAARATCRKSMSTTGHPYDTREK